MPDSPNKLSPAQNSKLDLNESLNGDSPGDYSFVEGNSHLESELRSEEKDEGVIDKLNKWFRLKVVGNNK